MANVSLTSLLQRAVKWATVEAEAPGTALVCSVQTAAASSEGA